MSEPITFPSGTANVGLPLLFAGQTQKEFFVNQALAILDALAPGAVEASLSAPPAGASDGDCYRIAAPATGDWSSHADKVALRIAGSWHFIAPTEGLTMFDRAAGQWIWFRSDWEAAPALSLPTGGSTIDIEARNLLAQLVSILRSYGLVAPQPA
jgi:Protein of unknown function (DUF2793)